MIAVLIFSTVGWVFYSVAAGAPAIYFLGANTSEMRLEVISSIVDFRALKNSGAGTGMLSPQDSLYPFCRELLKVAFEHPTVFSSGPRQHRGV